MSFQQGVVSDAINIAQVILMHEVKSQMSLNIITDTYHFCQIFKKYQRRLSASLYKIIYCIVGNMGLDLIGPPSLL